MLHVFEHVSQSLLCFGRTLPVSLNVERRAGFIGSLHRVHRIVGVRIQVRTNESILIKVTGRYIFSFFSKIDIRCIRFLKNNVLSGEISVRMEP